MRCDFCGQETEKNYFVDDFTILCKNCAEHSGIIGGKQAMDYIKKKAKRAETIAVVATFTAVLAVVLAVKASENNPGHIQIARF